MGTPALLSNKVTNSVHWPPMIAGVMIKYGVRDHTRTIIKPTLRSPGIVVGTADPPSFASLLLPVFPTSSATSSSATTTVLMAIRIFLSVIPSGRAPVVVLMLIPLGQVALAVPIMIAHWLLGLLVVRLIVFLLNKRQVSENGKYFVKKKISNFRQSILANFESESGWRNLGYLHRLGGYAGRYRASFPVVSCRVTVIRVSVTTILGVS